MVKEEKGVFRRGVPVNISAAGGLVDGFGFGMGWRAGEVSST